MKKNAHACHTCALNDSEKTKQLKELKVKLIISSIVSIILIFGSMVPFAPHFLKNKILLWILATPIQFWVGWQFYVSAFKGLKKFKTNMYTLIALGTSVAYFYSVFVILFESWFIRAGIPTHVYFEASCAITTFILLGQYLEIQAKGKASLAIQKLMHLQPQKARVFKNDNWVEIEAKDIALDDIILIKPGEKIPVDGIIIEGHSAIDESMITGESMPVKKGEGQQVIGATINMTGAFKMKAKKIGKDTMLARIIDMVKKAQSSKVPIQNLVDVISSYFVPAVIITAIIAGILWGIYGPQPRILYALVAVVSVLIIACPCALGLAIPTSVVVAIGRGAKEGILVKEAKVFQEAKKITVVVFDKTGTLTMGQQEVKDFTFVENVSTIFDEIGLKNRDHKKYVFSAVLSIERLSGHPVSEAVIRYLQRDHKEIKVDDFQALLGLGVKAFVDNHEIIIGSRKLIEQNGVHISQEANRYDVEWSNKARTISFVSIDKRLVAFFCLADTIRPGAKSTIQKLKQMGIESVMLTGDNEKIASIVAKEVGITRFFAKVLPEEKALYVRKLKEEGNFVAMVGDGINDAPALVSADVGIAIGSGTDVAIESAEAALLRPDILLVPKLIMLANATMSNMYQNLAWAFGYNTILVPIAAGLLYPFWHIMLSPMLAGAAMSFSSVSVVLNALRLRNISLD